MRRWTFFLSNIDPAMALRKVGEKALLAAEKHETKVPKPKQQTILNEDKYAEVRHHLRMSFIIAHQTIDATTTALYQAKYQARAR